MENLKITFLGGVGEIGKNMTAFEYGNDIILVDCGSAFPNDNMPGIDLVVQDISYLLANKNKIRGIFFTHGHEDHIGSVPYVLSQIKLPLYGSRMTLALVENKLRETSIKNIKMTSVKGGSVVSAGNFKVEFVNMTHSIPGAMALVITTPVGVVVHTGDFKIDFTPIAGDGCDLKRLAEVGKKGVLLFMSDSTNIERDGFSMSESVVGKTMDTLFNKYRDKRIFIATFSSNVHRLQQIMDISQKYNRKVVFGGRSMINVADIAIKLGELKCDRKNIVDIEKIEKYEDKELVIITTGSQGEEMSALTRISTDNFPRIRLDNNDVVIFSSAPIPGNEKSINTVINNLYRRDCTVIYNELADVHASGHANREEIKIMHSLIKPKYFLPVHGEYRHLKKQQLLAMELGMKQMNTLIPEIGMQVEVNKNLLKPARMVQAGEILLDGTGAGDIESNVLRDRKILSEDGICVVVLNLSEFSRKLIGQPDIISRGLIYQDEASELITQAKEFITKGLEGVDLKDMDTAEIKALVKKVATSFFSKKTKRRPMIVTIIVNREEK